MTLPDRDDVQRWLDRNVVDADGVDLGPGLRVYADHDSGAQAWLLISRPQERTAVVPLQDAADVDGQIRISVSRDQVDDAPQPADVERLSTDEEAALYRHYGGELSTSTPDRVLPASVTDADAPAAATTDTFAASTAASATYSTGTADRANSAEPASGEPTAPPALAAAQPTPTAAGRVARTQSLPILGAVAAILAVLIARRRRKRRSAGAARPRAARRAVTKRAAQVAAVAAPAQFAAAKAATNVVTARSRRQRGSGGQQDGEGGEGHRHGGGHRQRDGRA